MQKVALNEIDLTTQRTTFTQDKFYFANDD